MRSMSGTGMDRGCPNMRPAEMCFGIWSTVVAVKTFFERRALASGRMYSWPAGLWTEGLPM